jgi:hypothetical protein
MVSALAASAAHAGLEKVAFTKVSDKIAAQLRNVHAHPKALDVFRVQALRNFDGSVDLYFTADPDQMDALPQDPSPDYTPKIKKVTLKISDPDGTHVRTEVIQVGGLLGVVYHRTDLTRHQKLDASAVVDNVVSYALDSNGQYQIVKRNNVVMADSSVVNNRPDLQIVQVESPANALLATPYFINITIREVGGDLPGVGICYAAMQVGLTPGQFGQTNPTLVSVDPGETVICRLNATFSMSGTYQIKAEVVPQAYSQYMYLKEDNLANNEEDVPVTIAPRPDENYALQGFAYGGVSAIHRKAVQSQSGTLADLETYAPYNYYFEANETYFFNSDEDTASVYADGVVANKWLTYPLTVDYRETGGDGVQVLDATGTSSEPLSTWSQVVGAFDPVTVEFKYYFAEQQTDMLVDAASGTLFTINGYRSTALDTGELVGFYTDVASQRMMGHQIYVNTGTEAYRYNPDDPFTNLDLDNTSVFVYPTEVPSNMVDTYGVALSVTDGDGNNYSESATVQLPRVNQDYNIPYSCYGYDYTTDWDYHQVYSACQGADGQIFFESGTANFP